MVKKTIFASIFLALVFALAACTSSPTPKIILDIPPADTPGPQQQGSNNASLESKLAMGTLKLEGTNLAVTADEAKTLLPLWQKVKDLSTSGTPSPSDDLQAIYKQIEQAMTSDQIQNIQQMNLTSNDIQALMQNLGIQVTPFAGQTPGSFPTLTDDERATRTAQRGTQNPGGNGFRGTGTPGAGQFAGGRGFGEMNNMFIDSLIKLLTDRAGA